MTDSNESNRDTVTYPAGNPLLTLKNELLLNAVVRGELPTVRRLLDRHGADINSVNFSGLTCLQLAILNQHTKLAEYLIQKGVNIHMMDVEGWNALH
ncbi:MAG: ankyrin repeat domain-containing protein, partial [Proteobacteria bacterium]|nr:ankyrin repeat domain-containing protein [Pseudomonadota bacterium]